MYKIILLIQNKYCENLTLCPFTFNEFFAPLNYNYPHHSFLDILVYFPLADTFATFPFTHKLF